MPEPPLVIDLDGTLLRSDLLLETGLLYVRERPTHLMAPLRWLMSGKAMLKGRLSEATELDVASLPYETAVVRWIEAERTRGRCVVLATASHVRLAQKVAEHLSLFNEVIATGGERNLSATAKRDALVTRFGERGFDYAGNSVDDLPVWRSARHAYVVNGGARVERLASAIGNVKSVLRSEPPALRDWIKALRLHQWVKNLLIFVPLLTAHRYSEGHLIFDALLAFFCFGLCASSVYVLNDLLDLVDDRHHPSKRDRPFASGKLSIRTGLLAFPGLLFVALGVALWQLPIAFSVALGTYFALTLAYSLVLKRRMVIDVVLLAGLYTLRVVAGALALDISLSFWLLAFSMFIFLSLALVKRYAELHLLRLQGSEQKARGRGYFLSDLPMVASLGAAAGYMAVLVLALYINDAETARHYGRPEFIWLACPLLLFWITRVWMLTHRGQMTEDPVVFAVRDRTSLLIGSLVVAVFWAAT